MDAEPSDTFSTSDSLRRDFRGGADQPFGVFQREHEFVGIVVGGKQQRGPDVEHDVHDFARGPCGQPRRNRLHGLRAAGAHRTGVGRGDGAGPRRGGGVEQSDVDHVDVGVVGQVEPERRTWSTRWTAANYTVFTPTDDAFKKLPQSTIDTLKTDSDLFEEVS